MVRRGPFDGVVCVLDVDEERVERSLRREAPAHVLADDGEARVDDTLRLDRSELDQRRALCRTASG